eukprot:GILK01009210.1.p1 GENE.GILK01009210.1~~GILK01009210.1.p1  ORF type:complete len:528 (+),score=99.86 GILK01009210.1:125-1585(+)
MPAPAVSKRMSVAAVPLASKAKSPQRTKTEKEMAGTGESFRPVPAVAKSMMLQEVKQNIAPTEEVMRQNVEQMLARNENLEALEEKTADLRMQSEHFQRQAKRPSSSGIMSSLSSLGSKISSSIGSLLKKSTTSAPVPAPTSSSSSALSSVSKQAKSATVPVSKSVLSKSAHTSAAPTRVKHEPAIEDIVPKAAVSEEEDTRTPAVKVEPHTESIDDTLGLSLANLNISNVNQEQDGFVDALSQLCHEVPLESVGIACDGNIQKRKAAVTVLAKPFDNQHDKLLRHCLCLLPSVDLSSSVSSVNHLIRDIVSIAASLSTLRHRGGSLVESSQALSPEDVCLLLDCIRAVRSDPSSDSHANRLAELASNLSELKGCLQEQVQKICIPLLKETIRSSAFLETKEKMDTSDARLETFDERWPHAKQPHMTLTPEIIAKAGFFLYPLDAVPDLCMCSSKDCKANVSFLQPHDGEDRLKQLHVPSCPFHSS